MSENHYDKIQVTSQPHLKILFTHSDVDPYSSSGVGCRY